MTFVVVEASEAHQNDSHHNRNRLVTESAVIAGQILNCIQQSLVSEPSGLQMGRPKSGRLNLCPYLVD